MIEIARKQAGREEYTLANIDEHELRSEKKAELLARLFYNDTLCLECLLCRRFHCFFSNVTNITIN